MRTPRIKAETPQARPVSVIVHEKKKRKPTLNPLGCALALTFILMLAGWHQYRMMQESLATRDADLTKRAGALADAKALLNSKEALSETIQAELDAIRTLHLNRLLQTADFVVDDPAMSKRILEESIHFANANKLDITPIQKRIAALPKAKQLMAGTKLSILDVKHTASTSIVELTVLDSKLTPISELGRVDFTVSHKGKPIHPVRVEPTMITNGNHWVSFLMDCSTSFAQAMPVAKRASKGLVTDLAGPCKQRVVSFANDVKVVSPWSHDASIHVAAIDNLKADGATSLFAAMDADAREQSAISGIHSTVILTDGKDSHGTVSIDNILRLYQESGTRVHILALDRGDIDEPILQRIAKETDGSFQKLGNAQELSAGFKAIAERMKTPVYRLTILGPVDRESLTVQLANQSVAVSVPSPQLTSAKISN